MKPALSTRYISDFSGIFRNNQKLCYSLNVFVIFSSIFKGLLKYPSLVLYFLQNILCVPVKIQDSY